MSKGYWQTERQIERLGSGGTITQKIAAYEKAWMDRCYPNGIPDEIPEKLAKTNRVPSYKAIAMCILRNDLNLRGLGFGRESSQILESLLIEKKEAASMQMRLL